MQQILDLDQSRMCPDSRMVLAVETHSEEQYVKFMERTLLGSSIFTIEWHPMMNTSRNLIYK
jgi:hypothetical protein